MTGDRYKGFLGVVEDRLLLPILTLGNGDGCTTL